MLNSYQTMPVVFALPSTMPHTMFNNLDDLNNLNNLNDLNNLRNLRNLNNLNLNLNLRSFLLTKDMFYNSDFK